MATIYGNATRFTANEITITRGTVADITAVGVFHTLDPEERPVVGDFDIVTLVQPGDPLADGTKTDILANIGPKLGADLNLGTPGDYQRWGMVQTANEDIIEPIDVLEVT